MSQTSEFELIARYFRPLADAAGAYALTDDAASLSIDADGDLVVTKDAIVEGVHFLADERPETVAGKALRVNLSDLMAKGARPTGYLLLLGLGDRWTEDWVAGFAKGLAADQARYGVTLLGGDTVRVPGPMVVSVTLFGEAGPGGMVRRGAACAGDAVYVSGTIGEGALGLLAAQGHLPDGLQSDVSAALERRYRLPEPPVVLTDAVSRYARAAMDISDGLVGDLDKMCQASGVSATIHADRVPLSDEAQAAIACDPALVSTALTGGDDYQVLAAIAPENAAAFEQCARDAGVGVTAIGGFVEEAGPVTVIGPDGTAMDFAMRSYVHGAREDEERDR